MEGTNVGGGPLFGATTAESERNGRCQVSPFSGGTCS